MLTRVPFRFCSIALIMAVPTIPTAADFGKTVSGKKINFAAKSVHSASPTSSAINSPASLAIKKQEMSVALSNEQGKKFVANYIRHNDEDLYVVRKRSEGPFSIIDSELKPSALSRVGARGPWQLMPTTAHELGLKVNRGSDDRTNYYKSTVAAAKYLRDLHREFGDWLLVLAAYNGGPVPVIRAIHQAHSRSFWALQKYLPAESRGHVKKFIATAWYFEGAQKARPSAKPDVQLVSAPVRVTSPAEEMNDEKFQRLMMES